MRLQCGRPELDPWVGEIPWGRERLPTPELWPGEFHGLCIAHGVTESDATERLSLSLYRGCHTINLSFLSDLLSMTLYRTIHVAENGIISFFAMAE